MPGSLERRREARTVWEFIPTLRWEYILLAIARALGASSPRSVSELPMIRRINVELGVLLKRRHAITPQLVNH